MAFRTSPRISTYQKVYPFWALVNLVREKNPTYVLNAAEDILPDVEGCDNKEEGDAWIVSHNQIARTLHHKDMNILAHSAILT